MKEVVLINGDIFKPNEAKISIFDRGFLYADSIYDVIPIYNGVPFLLEEHIERLYHCAQSIDMSFSFTKNKLIKQIFKTLNLVKAPLAYTRIIITRGIGELSLVSNPNSKNNLIIITKSLSPPPCSWYKNGVNMITTQKSCFPSSPPEHIKSGNYLSNILAMSKARKQNSMDAIMLNSEGNITEATTSNIWIVEDNKFITPPPKAGILNGITRKTLLKLIKQNKLEVFEENISPQRLLNASECFLSSSTKEIVPIVRVDNQDIANGLPGNKTKNLIKIYKSFILKEVSN